MTRTILPWLVLMVLALLTGPAQAQQLPEDPGLAAKYPGDVSIEKDDAVIFVENFESGDLGKWDDNDPNAPPEVRLVTKKELVHSGRGAVQLEARVGEGAGGDLTKLFMPGYDRVYARYYTRFAPDFDQGNLMHFVHLAGLKDRWQLGRSGKKPDGTDFFSTGLEPWRNWGRNPAPGAMGFYSYFVDMKPDPSGPYYGNPFRPDSPPVLIQRGRWYCMEMMVKANTPGRADGEQAFWVDGQLKGHYTGIRWRTTDKLKINCLWVLLYIHKNKQVNRVCFDDVVVATEYIGPQVPAGSAEGKGNRQDQTQRERQGAAMGKTTRVAAVQAKRRLISYKIATPEEALRKVQENLDALIPLAEKAAGMGCDIVAFPEDTLGTIAWEAGHPDELAAFLRRSEQAMLSRFGEVAAKHGMYIICGSDTTEEGRVYCSAILIGRDGKEIGRYHKVHPPILEASTPGDGFPVFEAPGIGTVGMCICYDITMPETTRALTLAGADIVFHITMGGASMAGPEASLACFKARAAENFIYLVSAFRSGGSLIISPKGEILAKGGREPDAIVTADIDLAAGRDAGDAHGGITSDFRARLFRERNPQAYGVLMDENPAILDKLRDIHVPTREEAQALFADALTTGSDAFYEAERLLSEGKTAEARQRFEELSKRFGTAWIGRASRDRLKKIANQER